MLEQPDIDRFRLHAEIFGFDVYEYLEALEDIPVVSEEKLRSVTAFLGEMACLISKLGYSNLIAKQESLRLENEIAERKRSQDVLSSNHPVSKSSLTASTTGAIEKAQKAISYRFTYSVTISLGAINHAASKFRKHQEYKKQDVKSKL